VWLLSWLANVSGCVRPEAARPSSSGSIITVEQEALYPETVVYERKREVFLVGSVRQGAVHQIDALGRVRPLIEDRRLISVLGIALDEARDRLWVTNADPGASTRTSAATLKQVAAVAVYELSTGRPLHYIDLAPLAAGPHLLNGIAVDGSGSAYVTDSFTPVIYRVDPQGGASVFLWNDQFSGEGINLNGIVVHPDGYLLAIKKSDGGLFKVPLEQPTQLSRVVTDAALHGGDGLLLLDDQHLLVVANSTAAVDSNSVVALASDDAWGSAVLAGQLPLDAVYPTTAVVRQGRVHVLHSKLGELLKAAVEAKLALRERAVLRDVGTAAELTAAKP
jgi:sugar lactone lactonase YvrE